MHFNYSPDIFTSGKWDHKSDLHLPLAVKSYPHSQVGPGLYTKFKGKLCERWRREHKFWGMQTAYDAIIFKFQGVQVHPLAPPLPAPMYMQHDVHGFLTYSCVHSVFFDACTFMTIVLIPLTASADDQAATGDVSTFSDELLHLTDAQAADRCLRHEARAADMYPCVLVMFSSGFACSKVQIIDIWFIIMTSYICITAFQTRL